VQDRYPIGSAVPVEPWLTDGLQQLMQEGGKWTRLKGERGMYLVQRFQSWRVYPVRVGRWYRSTEQSVALNDPIGGAWYTMRAIVGAGHWKPRAEITQVIDPGSGRPIAEHVVDWHTPSVGKPGFPGPEIRAMAVLGDPRVCGLFAVFGDQVPPTVAWGCNRHAGNVKWTPEDIEKQAAKLIGRPYEDFSFKEDGPWIIDHPEPPSGGKTRWGRYSPGD
jgi:hypothetical protein